MATNLEASQNLIQLRPNGLSNQARLLLVAEHIFAFESLVKLNAVRTNYWVADPSVYGRNIELCNVVFDPEAVVGQKVKQARFDDNDNTISMDVRRDDASKLYDDPFVDDVVTAFDSFYVHPHQQCPDKEDESAIAIQAEHRKQAMHVAGLAILGGLRPASTGTI